MEAAVTPSPRKARRATPKAPNLNTETIARQAKADAERKRASKKVLREALARAKPEPVQPVETPEQVQRQRNLDAARAEAEATGMSFEGACASMGIDPETGAVGSGNEGYDGPMLALRRRLKAGAYRKAENGQPCCGDAIAVLCGQYSREVVVKALVAALGLGGNPYTHLNPGQQSMNLRNKARAAVKSGQLELATIEAALVAAAAAAVNG